MAKKNSKKAKPEVTLEQLQAVAEDFNSFMVEEGEEGIDIDLDQEDLLEEVTEAAADLVEDDVITQETADTLEALGIDHVAQVGEAPEEDPEKDEDPEEDVDPEEDDDVDPDGESIEEMLDRAKAAKIAVPPPFRKDKEKLQAYLAKKLPATKPAGKKGKAEAKPAEKKGKAAEKKTPKAPKGNSLQAYLAKLIPDGLGKKHEDSIVLKAKEKFEDKPLRVIGNVLYSYLKGIGKPISRS